jgi:hypothetical protein
MSSIKGVNSSGGKDPYESIQNVGNQAEIDSAQGVSKAEPQSALERPEELRDKEKKGMEQYAAERIAEEQIKAQMKQTQLADDLDGNQPGGVEQKDLQKQDRSRFDYHDPDNQAVPFQKQNGEYQRWNIADKKWE